MTNPFRGLLPFDEEHAWLFFGRDQEIKDIATRLDNRRLLAITGVSGSGKSSLVLAGVIPMLKAGLIPRLGNLRVSKMKPGGGPLAELRKTLEVALERVIAPETLAGTTYGLIDAVKPPWSGGNLTPEESLLIVVDQFEEIFPYRREHFRTDAGAEADRFVALLLRAIEQTDVPIYVILTMRSEFIGDCSIFRDLPEALNNGHYLVPRMTRHQLQDAIEAPLKIAGVSIAPSLTQKLLNLCREEQDPLPVLQHLMKRMFEEATSPQGSFSVSPPLVREALAQ